MIAISIIYSLHGPFVRSIFGSKIGGGTGRDAMVDEVRLPRKLSEEPQAPEAQRPSHKKVIEHLDRWANSRGLQPPRIPEAAEDPR
jgi:hypothetical protein